MAAANIVPATPVNVSEAARLVVLGRLVAFPTETVYGLGADATNDRAVAEIFAAKGRPRFNPLIIHVADRRHAEESVVFDARALRLADAFWPGPLTLVLPRRPSAAVSLLAGAGLDTLAVRVPAHEVALALLAAAGRPIAAPSANPSGQVSPTTAAHVAQSLGARVAMILDGGPCRIGVESTVLDLTGSAPTILRPGGATREEIERVAGPVVEDGADLELLEGSEDAASAPRSPGRLGRHYATRAPLRLAAISAAPGEALLAFGPHPITGALDAQNLSPAGDVVEAAANLFAMLRALDRPEVTAIAVMPIPEHGLGRAINDRLRRAAARAEDGPALARRRSLD